MTSQAKTICRRQHKVSSDHLPDSLDPVLRNVFLNRGITAESQLVKNTGQLLSYKSLRGIDEAADLLATAITERWRILIVGDFDADGATSTALSVLSLRAMGAEQVDYLVPNRFEFGYGLSPEIVAVAAERQPHLIMTVDNGISSIEGVQAARDMGIKVLVTDHHLQGEQLPTADAIVNPNQHGCEFPSKAACGCAVAFYVLTALKAKLKTQQWFQTKAIPEPNMADFLDIVALATVADVVPLDHNNRIFVHQGIARIRAGKARPGILAILEIAGKKLRGVAASDLGFAVGPRLNAAGRLDDMSMGIECLLADDSYQAKELAIQLDEMNQDRKAIESGMQEQALEYLRQFREVDNPEQLPWGVSLFEQDWHEGVIGILASRIKDRLHRPVIAFAQAENGMVKGSARSIPGFHIRDGLDAVAKKYPEVLSKFGGHAMAAGLSVPAEYFDTFKKAFDDEVRAQLNEQDLVAQVMSDGALPQHGFTLEMATLLRDSGPWGQAYPEPTFDGEFKLIQQKILGHKHLKLVVSPVNSDLLFDAIAFNVDLDIWPSEIDHAIIVFKLDINEFRGNISLQLMVEYIEPKLN